MYLVRPAMSRIALFGTSADPPSVAHRDILVWLSQRFDWVAVWASDNPFKTQQTKLEHRLAMLQITIAELGKNYGFDNIGFHPELSYPRAIATVTHAREHWPRAELTFTIGSDLLPQLDRWHCIEALCHQVSFLVLPRESYPIEGDRLQNLRKWGANVVVAKDVRIPGVSSTAYRQSLDSATIIAPVEAYIDRENLYARYQNAMPQNARAQNAIPQNAMPTRSDAR